MSDRTERRAFLRHVALGGLALAQKFLDRAAGTYGATQA